MKRKQALLFFLILLCLTPYSHAQNWAGILSPNRAVDWSKVGVPGGIPTTYTQCGSTVAAGNTSAINSAIAACTSGHFVQLSAGTFSGAGIIFNNKSGVIVRGMGADQTFINFTSSASGCGVTGDVCFMGDNTNPEPGNGGTSVSWTAGYSKGTTSITLSSVSGLSVGKYILLNQLDDPNPNPGTDIWICGTGATCATEGPSGGQITGRSQEQWVKVTNIAGNVVTISPGLNMPNWVSGKSPQAWWTANQLIGSGIENVSMTHTSSSAQAATVMFNAFECWVKGVRDINSDRSHVWLFTSAHDTIRDSYFFGTKNSVSQSYGIESYISSDVLVENNIFQQVVAPFSLNGATTGFVGAYNFTTHSVNSNFPTSGSAGIWMHAAGIDNVLFEGNVGQAFFGDDIHGTHNFLTVFRNYFPGWSPGQTSQIFPLAFAAFSRFSNAIGNVLGRTGVQTSYQGTGDTVIYSLGLGAHPPADDSVVATTLMRWGNYDTVNAAVRFVSGEVPSGIANFPNPVPASQTLPASFYLSAKPSWWPASTPWPPIGPDVSGGTVEWTGGSTAWVAQTVGGHANNIPAQNCFKNVMRGPADGTGNTLTFNASNCYGTTAGAPAPPPTSGPAPPTNLGAVVL